MFLKIQLERRKLNPRQGKVGKLLTVFLVNLSYSVQLAQLLFKLNIGLENLLLRKQPDWTTKNFPSLFNIVTTQTKVCVLDPKLTESKLLVRNQFYYALVYMVGLFHVLSNLFLENSVIEPNVNVSAPESFFLRRRKFFDCCFVDLPSFLNVFGVLL